MLSRDLDPWGFFVLMLVKVLEGTRWWNFSFLRMSWSLLSGAWLKSPRIITSFSPRKQKNGKEWEEWTSLKYKRINGKRKNTNTE